MMIIEKFKSSCQSNAELETTMASDECKAECNIVEISQPHGKGKIGRMMKMLAQVSCNISNLETHR
jgi:hypothetical protein